MNIANDLSQPDLDLLLEPVDWEHLRRMAALTPGQRMLAMAEVSAFSRAMLRGAFRRRYPDLPIEEINMLMFHYIEEQKAKGLWASSPSTWTCCAPWRRWARPT